MTGEISHSVLSFDLESCLVGLLENTYFLCALSLFCNVFNCSIRAAAALSGGFRYSDLVHVSCLAFEEL